MKSSFFKQVCAAIICVLACRMPGISQPSFFHLTSAEGLPDDNVRSLAIDGQGFLWIGTTEGLCVFDGYRVSVFQTDHYPELASNYINHLSCDRHGRIWIGSSSGASWIDGDRSIHRVVVDDSTQLFAAASVADTKTYGPVIISSLGQIYQDSGSKRWKRLDWIPPYLDSRHFRDAIEYEDNQVLFATDSLVTILDYAKQKVVFEQPFRDVVSVCRNLKNEIAVAFVNGRVVLIDPLTKTIKQEYQLTSQVSAGRITPELIEIRSSSNGDLLITTAEDGLMVIHPQGGISQYQHDPIHEKSIGSNLTRRVIGSPDGNVIVSTSTAGVSCYNINNRTAVLLDLFVAGRQEYYDGYLTDIAESSDGIFWIGARDRLIEWDRGSGMSRFYVYQHQGQARTFEIRTLCVDRQDQVWVGTLGDGVSYFDKRLKRFVPLPPDPSLPDGPNSRTVLDLYTARDGSIWVAVVSGVFHFDPAKRRFIAMDDMPALQELRGKRINVIREDEAGQIWFGAHQHGVYAYNPENQTLRQYTSKDGLASDQCFSLCPDGKGKIYAACSKGFSIIPGAGNIESYDSRNGLVRYDRCDGLLMDDAGNIWISNIKFLVRYDPGKKSFRAFGQNAGIIPQGIRAGGMYRSRSGELFWCGWKGMNFFVPNQLHEYASLPKVVIYGAERSDTSIYFSGPARLNLRYVNNNILFRFTSINLQGSNNVQYRFMLEGFEKEWHSGIDLREVRYPFLPSGHYTFRVKASEDGINWIDARNPVELRVIPPLWQREWFIGLLTALLIGTLLYIIRNRNKQLRKKQEQLETEQAISYFISSMSTQETEEEILWDFARNCIARLHIQDCVIFMIDEDRHMLVQKAVAGPERPSKLDPATALEIKIGDGVVGTVARTGTAEIIPDTRKEPRYIMDIENHLSEISVPIISGGKVLGVIDCEHSKKTFFTQKHLSILTTIASLCANRIVRARAEEEKRLAKSILMDTQRKMTEVEMQALRAQMNPHFIFNCLNSINRYIVKSDQTTASLYLTKFAKLIRLILDNSNSKNVILTNELEALKLYIEMEALRFDKKFTYDIKVEPGLSTDSVEVPPLIIQPYVENAIWHGLLHKEEGGHLSIRLSLQDETMLTCEIDDNGVGRQKAKEMKSKTATSRKSLGMQLTEHRLNLLNKHAELNASVEIIDKQNGHQEPAGTRVILKIPI